MKLEALQSISVIVLITGLFLSALGAFGTYYFGGRTETAQRRPTPSPVRIAEQKLTVRDTARDAWLASIVEPVANSTSKPLTLAPLPTPRPVVADLTVTLPPIAEKLIDESPGEATLVLPAPIALESEPAYSTITIPEKPASAKSAHAHFAGLGIAPAQLEKLLQRLRTFDRGTIVIQAPEGSEEAWRFASALKEAFVAGGWRVIGVKAVKTAREPNGLTLSSGTFPPPSEVTTVFSALVAAGIKLSTDLDPSQGKQHAVLFVGSRP
jgi:hypothetical protein